MQKMKFRFTMLLFFISNSTFAQNTTLVKHFDKVIVSPHIEVIFIEGNEESVTIEKSTENADKINMEVNGETLRIYLDDAKEVTKTEKVYENGNEVKRPIYKGTVVTATITYKSLHELSVRGNETFVCKSKLKGNEFKLIIYGESQVFLNEVDLGELKTVIYGESMLSIKSGSIADQKYTAYGESKVNTVDIKSITAKITVYGESKFKLNVSNVIKITSFGEAEVEYKGNAIVDKGLNIGHVKISKIE
jgi:Putative auto-transporter adhesin, head GIN domain